ncbi:peroxiredoxin Q, chloroplastic [Tanacetum coccineum]
MACFAQQITTSTTVGRLLPPCSSFSNGTNTTSQLPQLKSQFHGLKLSHNSSTHSNNTNSKTTPLRVYAAKVNKGSVPPAFTLKDQDGKTVSLSKFKGKPLVLYFYPADETPGLCFPGLLRKIQESRSPGCWHQR